MIKKDESRDIAVVFFDWKEIPSPKEIEKAIHHVGSVHSVEQVFMGDDAIYYAFCGHEFDDLESAIRELLR